LPAQPQQRANPLSDPAFRALAKARDNPYLTEGQKTVIDSLMKQKMEAEKEAKFGFTAAGDTVYRTNPKTGEVTAVQSVTKKSGDVSDYEYAKGQGYEGSFRDYQVEIKNAGASRVNIDQTGENAFDKEAAKGQAKRYADIVDDGLKANEFIGSLNALQDIGTKLKGGATDQAKAALAPYAQSFGIKLEGGDEAQAYEALIAKLVPAMRVVGSGSTSDFEGRQFAKSLPSLGQSPAGKQLITDTLQAFQEHKMKAADIASMVLNKEITRKEGDKQLREMPDPWTSWKANKKNFDLTGADIPMAQPAAKGATGATKQPEATKQTTGATKQPAATGGASGTTANGTGWRVMQQ
jgi:hypothetical protein